MLNIWRNYREQRDLLYMLCSLVFVICGVWLELKLPDEMRELTALVQTTAGTMGQVFNVGGSMLLCSLGSLASSIAVGFFTAHIAAGLAMRLREAIYCKVGSAEKVLSIE